MKSLRIVLALLCVGFVARGAEPAKSPEVAIAIEGKARLPIISGKVAEPAQELRETLKRMTGTDFTVEKSGDKTPGIYVGLDTDFPNVNIDDPAKLGAEGFVMKTDAGSIYLIGHEPAGVAHAVTTFLQRLGCRWYFPGDVWEVIPKKSTIAIRLDERQTPSMSVGRVIWYGFGAYAPCAKDLKSWNHHNRMGGPTPIQIGHTWFGLAPEKDFTAHPEWFAEVKGERKKSKPCYSHPDVIKQAKEYALARAAEGHKMISLSPPDGLGFCECERCKAVGQGGEIFHKHGTAFAKRPDGVVVGIATETLYACVNQAAAAVAEKYPQTRIGCYAYSAYSQPPSFKLHPNVFVQATTAYRRTDLTLAEQLDGFKKAGCRAGIREYFSVYQWDWDAKPPKGKLSPAKIGEQMKRYHELGVEAIGAESSNNWAPRGLSYYLAAQLMWDVNADTKALTRDFFDTAFGPAAAPMERYYKHWYGSALTEDEPATGELDDAKDAEADPSKLAQMFKDLDEAAKLAKDRPDCLARVDHLRMYLHYLVLRQKTQQAGKGKGKNRDKDAIIAAVKAEVAFGARLTYTNMIHSRPLLGKAFERRFRPYVKILEGVPELQRDSKGLRAVGKPPTHEEVEKFWEEDRAVLVK
jgi:hypothetical protein